MNNPLICYLKQKKKKDKQSFLLWLGWELFSTPIFVHLLILILAHTYFLYIFLVLYVIVIFRVDESFNVFVK